MAKRRIGPFELGNQLGVGGMGIVYRATYLKTGQQVALKVLTPALSVNKKLLARFEREMAILKKLRHQNIVRYYGGGTLDGQHFYAMEMMDEVLDDVLRRKRRLPWEKVVKCGREICKGLEHAHNAGVIHRDLKPANLFISQQGHLKIGDFGIARDTQATALTAAGSTVGTYAYMAPEQITGKKPVTRKTDLYALGCVLYELLTGQTPFVADTMPDMLMQHLQHEAHAVRTLAPECPVWLEALIEKLLEKEPEDRYYDALAVNVALKEVGTRVAEQVSVVEQTIARDGKQTVIAPGTVQIEAPRKRRKRKRKTGPFYESVWFLAACLALLIGLVTWWSWPLSEEQLYARAKVLMESNDIDDWREARERYLDPLLEKYPEGEYAVVARRWVDDIEVDKVARRVENRIARDLEAKAPEEARYREALSFEEFGDLAMAEAKYGDLVAALDGREEQRPMRLLAERRRDAIRAQWQNGTERLPSLQFVLQRLHDAEGFVRNQNSLKAQEIWREVIEHYAGNLPYAEMVLHSRNRLEGREAGPLERLP